MPIRPAISQRTIATISAASPSLTLIISVSVRSASGTSMLATIRSMRIRLATVSVTTSLRVSGSAMMCPKLGSMGFSTSTIFCTS